MPERNLKESKNLKTRALSFMLMSSMLAPSSAAYAQGIQDETPEFQLVANSAAIQGEGLSKKDGSAALQTVLQQYLHDSSSEQSSEKIANMEQAWIDLHLMTESQAHEVSQELTGALAKSPSTATDLVSSTNAIVQHVGGAEFSQCAVAGSFDAAFFVGGATAAIIGATVDKHENSNTFQSVPASPIAKPMEVLGLTAGLIGMVGIAYVAETFCGN
jgi:hypothetical protein